MRNTTKEGKKALRRLCSLSDTIVNRESHNSPLFLLEFPTADAPRLRQNLNMKRGAIRKANLYDLNTVSPRTDKIRSLTRCSQQSFKLAPAV